MKTRDGPWLPSWKIGTAPDVPAFVPRVAPFAALIVLVAAGPLIAPHADPRWVVAARGVVVAALLAIFWGAYAELGQGPRARPRDWAIAVALGAGVFLAWITFDSGWAAFGRAGGGFAPLGADGKLDPALALLRLAGFAIATPIAEEIFWRSFVLRWIDRRDFLAADPRRASVLAIALSSALFASEHDLWFAGLLAGLAYGGIYARTGNLRLSIASHASTNTILGAWILATDHWSYW